MDARSNWSAHQLAEFLAVVASFRDEPSAIRSAVERASEAVEAEVCAVLRDDRVVSIIGFPRDQTPHEELLAVAHGETATMVVPGAGACAAVSLDLDDDEPGALVLARSGSAFTGEELSLLRGMARVLTMTLRILRALESERRHAEQTAELLASLQDRQRLLERLAIIQQAITHRRPIAETLGAIATATGELIGDCMVGLRVVDSDDPTKLRLVASAGMCAQTAKRLEFVSLADGIAGQAMATQRLVVAERYDDTERPLPGLVGIGLYATMAAPMYRDAKVTGSLVVALTDPDRTFTQLETETLLTLAEHASLAFNDASAAEGMSRAFAEALHQANHDALTGLPNRTLALDRLAQALARCERLGAPVTVLFVDLDRFKRVNDSLGHSVGDDVLLCATERLVQSVRASDTVARLAGDEFLVICEGLEPRQIMPVARRIADRLADPMALGGRETIITASIGIAHGTPGADPEELVGNADVAMYRAKEAGRSGIELFDQEMRDQVLERLEIEHALRRALAAEEFTLDYQPVVDTVDGRLVAMEALLRWHDGGYGAPGKFLPVAEDTGLIKQIGAWVLKEACTQLASWRTLHDELADIYVSVNLSAIEFSEPSVVDVVAKVLHESGLPPRCLSLEITESVVMADAEVTTETLRRLKRLGIHLAVDDFGTGYSSLSYLKRLPVDVLKIDRSFVSQLDVNAEDQAIAAAIISLGDALGLDVVAEGVETPSQLLELQRLGCQAVQGFLVGRPQPAHRLLQDLAANGVLARS